MLNWFRQRLPLGPRGEREAARHLKRQGYRILARNVRNRFGEIDIVAQPPDESTVVIVEVKAGTNAAHRPEVHVNRAKQKKLVALAAQLQRHYKFERRPIRFDVIAVDFLADKPPVLRHHIAAFDSHV